MMHSGWKVMIVAVAALATGGTVTAQNPRAELMALERRSHQLWLERNTEALHELMDDGYRFVAMNGALETKEQIVGRGSGGRGTPGPLQVESLDVEPEEVTMHGTTAVVIALMRIEATVGGRPLPERMRVLSVYTRAADGSPWRLAARSITPIAPPAGPPPKPPAR